MGVAMNGGRIIRFLNIKKHIATSRYPLLFSVILFITVATILGAFDVVAGDERFLVLGFRGTPNDEPQSIPEGWEPLPFIRTAGNTVSLSHENGMTVLHVKSLSSASGILKRLKSADGFAVDLASHPFLVWRWKVSRTVGMAIESREDRNDCAARVRVICNTATQSLTQSDEIRKIADYIGITLPTMEPSGYKIDYIWSTRTPQGQFIDYPGEKNHKMFVLEQGNQKVNQWIWEKRNIIDDFRKCFNSEPPGIVGVVIVTDTDQTHEGVEAWYGSVVMMRK